MTENDEKIVGTSDAIDDGFGGQTTDDSEVDFCYFCGAPVSPDDEGGTIMPLGKHAEVPVCPECAAAMYYDEMSDIEAMENEDAGKEGEAEK